jgi:hypothetical protein
LLKNSKKGIIMLQPKQIPSIIYNL